MRREIARRLSVVLLLATIAACSSDGLAAADDGAPHFVGAAGASFAEFVDNPLAPERAWLNEHYGA